jgi:hypothetical protein
MFVLVYNIICFTVLFKYLIFEYNTYDHLNGITFTQNS